MTASETVTRAHLKTPSAAAIAGLVFSCLLIAAFWLLRISVPTDPRETGTWLRTNSDVVTLAINLVPFAGIAFLWFIGVLRDRLGQLEDRFFATVFFGSGVLFLAMLFLAAAVVGGLLIAFAAMPEELIGSATFQLCDDKRLLDKNGRRLHDYDVDDHSLHRDCAAVAGDFRICVGAAATSRQLLYQLEFLYFPVVGLFAERLHSRR
jgi:hypothetical protein